MAIISICNKKGGTGKSTMTIFLAAAFGRNGKKVLVIDTDSQHSIKSIWQAEDEPDLTPLFDLEVISPKFVLDVLKVKGDKYDLIFIDVPRSTEDSTNAVLAQMITLCDILLVPVLPSKMDVFSTIEFLKLVKEIEDFKAANDLPFYVAGFLNKTRNIAEDSLTKDVLADHGLSFLPFDLPAVKMFLYPSAFSSILDTKEGQNRFEKFYYEVDDILTQLEYNEKEK